MPETVNQEINVNINALVKRIQDIREFVALIRSLRENRGPVPVIVDEKISRNARAGAGDVKQLQTSIDELAKSIREMDGPTSRLARLFQIFGGIATVLGHLKSFEDGINVIKNVAPNLTNVGEKFNAATTAVRGFFTATRQRVGDGIAKAKENVSGLVDKLPSLIRGGGQTAGTIATIGGAGAGAAVGIGALVVVLGAVLAAVLAIVGAVAIFAFMFNLAEGAAEAGSEIHDLSQELGVSAETISTVKVATATTSTTFEEATQGISKFNKLIGEAADGSKEAAKDLTRLGVEPKAALKDSEAALAAVFKRIHELPTPYEKARAAQIAFGKSGANMVPVIDSVGGSLEKAKDKAKEFGQLLSTQGAKQADEFGDLIDEIKLKIEGFGLSIGRALIPELLRLLRVFNHEMPAAGGAFQFVIALISAEVGKLVRIVIDAIAALKTLAALPAALGVLISTGNLEAAFNLILERFRKERDELLRIANTEPTGGGSTGEEFEFGGTDKDKKPADTLDSRLALSRAGAQQIFDLEKDLLDRLQAIYRDAYENRRIDSETYFENEERLRAQQIQNEINFQEKLSKMAERRRTEELKQIAGDKDKTEAQKTADRTNVQNKFIAETAGISTRILILRRELEAIPGAVETEATAAAQAIESEITGVLALLDELNGKTRTFSDQIKKLLDSREKLLTTGGRSELDPLIQAIDAAIEHLRALDQIRNLDKQLQPLGQQFEIDKLEIETKVSREVLTQAEGRRQINELQRRHLLAQLEILKNELALTDDYRTQLEIKVRIANIEKGLAELDEQIDETARSINDSLRLGFEDFFASLADGTKNIKEAFADLGLFILQMFARLAAQKLVEGLFGNLLGNEQGQGGIGGVLSGIFGGKKAAGDMMNARPGGQLIQVAEAGFDELVVTTDPRYAERTAGLLGRFIERTGIVPQFASFGAGGFARAVGNTFANVPRLAAGAFVPAAGPETAFAAAGLASELTLHQTHNHVWNPRHLHDEMRGPAGQDTFLHNVDANKTTIKRMLGIR